MLIAFIAALVMSPAAVSGQVRPPVVPPRLASPPSVQADLLRQQQALRGLERRIQRLRDRDSISDLSQDEMLQLQQMMEEKARLEQMISNTMKAAGETQNGTTGNLKAS